ncbi:glycoside hydrolase family 6 protein [Dactylosporangium sp. NPDC005572]|uniref:glycoside hydrolase family 6 protein n=1 Tax=Dactylosporangium sp. NPDC005572 TaxID=3156889 RepID=UPI0033AC2544
MRIDRPATPRLGGAARLATAGTLLAAAGLGILAVRPAGADDAATRATGVASCTTDREGYCRIEHHLGRAPAAVVVTLHGPATGPIPRLGADGFTATDFRLRAVTPDGPYAGPLTVSYAVALGGGPSSGPSAVDPSSAPPGAAAGSPFAGGVAGSHPKAARQATEWRAGRPADAALMDRLARTPTALWLGDWTADVRAAADAAVTEAAATGATPVLVAYNLPGRDCGGHSRGGAGDEAGYGAWIRALAVGIGARRAAVVLEPDGLAQLCGDTAARYRMLGDAVGVLGAGPATAVYLDAGNALWLDAATMVERLRAAGVARARGFALNVSNFATTESSIRYGEQIVAGLGGAAHYVVDTGRNGNGPLSAADWCNPPGRALGAAPTANAGGAHADALLWIKVPGDSDGPCNGGPAAGAWMPEYALGLARAAWGG